MNFRIMESFGFEKYFKAIKKLVGKDPFTIDFPFEDLSNEKLEAFDSRKIYHFPGGIYDLVNGKLNKISCMAIEKMLGIADVCAISFCMEKRYFGGISLFIPASIIKSGYMNYEDELAIETISNQASTVIQRLRDRAALKNNEDTLVKSNLQIETLFENSSSGYVFEDVSRKVLNVNKAFSNMLGIPSAEMIIGMDCKIVCLKYASLFKDSENFVADVEKLIRENKATFNQELIMCDGRVLERDFIPIKNDKIAGFLWQFRDMTERKQIELKLKEQTEQLKELNSTKDKFFSILAHDLIGPFSSILGLSELLSTEYGNLTEDQRLSYFSMLHNSSNSTYKLLENLLEWARLQRGHIEIRKEVLDFRELVNDGIEPCMSNAIIKGITVTNKVTENMMINVENYSLKTVIRNLFNNAIKYTHSGGFIEISAFQNESDIEVSIKDTGLGMSQDTISKLFRIDENQSRLGTNDEKGTGLGLIICKELIAINNGNIWVESEFNIGTTFKFSIPIN
ncbi:MAG: PAS domain-containing sensor histidine kinase [Bacteroidota bacterium]|nr:PAS domain-containing sensor histidine kinase [Bacteroidota bacterium]